MKRHILFLLLVIAVVTLSACTVPATKVPPPTTPVPPTWTPFPPPTPTPERTPARVVRVVDGDTIVVRIEGRDYRVRYIGVDTPETVHPDLPVEWMGPEASAANAQMVAGKTVYLEKDVSEVDQYDRLLRYVFLADGTFVNAELVRLGYAQVSTYLPDVKYVELYLEMQREARAAGRGLWGPQPTRTPHPGD